MHAGINPNNHPHTTPCSLFKAHPGRYEFFLPILYRMCDDYVAKLKALMAAGVLVSCSRSLCQTYKCMHHVADSVKVHLIACTDHTHHNYYTEDRMSAWVLYLQL